MQLPTLAVILSLAAFGAAQTTSVMPCTNGKYPPPKLTISHLGSANSYSDT